MVHKITEPDAALRMARDDRDSVVGLIRELVRVPSRAGIDPYDLVLGCMLSWLAGRGMLPRWVPGLGGETVALVGEITGGRPGPRYLLDTARSATRQRGRTRRRPHRSPAGGCMAAARDWSRPDLDVLRVAHTPATAGYERVAAVSGAWSRLAVVALRARLGLRAAAGWHPAADRLAAGLAIAAGLA